MKRNFFIIPMVTIYVFSAPWVFAQAFGEYGRTLGGIPHGGITAPRAPGGINQSSGSNGGVGDIGGRGLPSRLIVAAKAAGLYPRQDDEAEKMDQLAQGDILVPMVQSSGGNDWFMVKTQKGIIGWVKAVEVRAETAKK